jgi:hypothetical protein
MKSVTTLLRAATACAVCLCFANATQAADTPPADAATALAVPAPCQNACARPDPAVTLAATTNELHTGPALLAPQQPQASGTKSRDDVIAELVQARQNGTYVPASEIYPDSTLPAASPVR